MVLPSALFLNRHTSQEHACLGLVIERRLGAPSNPPLFVLCRYRSETDTEVIAHLVGLELDADPNMELKLALAKTVAKLDGTWGLAVIAHEK